MEANSIMSAAEEASLITNAVQIVEKNGTCSFTKGGPCLAICQIYNGVEREGERERGETERDES